MCMPKSVSDLMFLYILSSIGGAAARPLPRYRIACNALRQASAVSSGNLLLALLPSAVAQSIRLRPNVFR